jgi:membrane protease YdiL (CAAX protease family)
VTDRPAGAGRAALAARTRADPRGGVDRAGGVAEPGSTRTWAARAWPWFPVGALAVGAAVPAARVAVAVLLVTGAAILLARDARSVPTAGLGRGAGGRTALTDRVRRDLRRLTGGVRAPLTALWLGCVPLGVALAWTATLAPSMALPDATRCTDLLSPTATARGTEALVIVGLVALLAPLARQPGALRLRWPSRGVVLLSVAAPLAIIPATLWIGPALAAPFFGQLNLVTGDLRALIPAAGYAIGNALLEELAYRGALMGWGAAALGPLGAVVGQAIVFGFAHMGTDVEPAMAPLLWAAMATGGLIAGVAVIRTRSLLLAFAVHAAVDVSLYYAMACRIPG